VIIFSRSYVIITRGKQILQILSVKARLRLLKTKLVLILKAFLNVALFKKNKIIGIITRVKFLLGDENSNETSSESEGAITFLKKFAK
jgi:hypothetical protein